MPDLGAVSTDDSQLWTGPDGSQVAVGGSYGITPDLATQHGFVPAAPPTAVPYTPPPMPTPTMATENGGGPQPQPTLSPQPGMPTQGGMPAIAPSPTVTAALGPPGAGTPPPAMPAAKPAGLTFSTPASGTPTGTPSFNFGGFGMEQKGVQEEAKAKGELGKQMAQEIGNANTAAETQDQAIKKVYDETNKTVGKQIQGYQDKMTELLNTKIEPGRYWKNMDTGHKWLAALSILGGSIGNVFMGKPGAPNPAWEIINKAIDQDIDAQKSEIEKKGTAVNAQGNLIKFAMDQGMNQAQAEIWAKAAKLEQSKRVLDKITANAQGPLAAAEAKKNIGMIETQKAQLMNQLYMEGVKTQLQMSGRIIKLPDMSDPKTGQPTGPKYVVASSDKAGEEGNTVVSARNSFHDSVEKIKQIYNKVGGEILPTEEKENMQRELANAQLSLRKIYDVTRLSPQAEEYFNAVIDPKSYRWSPHRIQDLSAAQQMIDREMSNVLSSKAAGYSSAAQKVRFDQ